MANSATLSGGSVNRYGLKHRVPAGAHSVTDTSLSGVKPTLTRIISGVVSSVSQLDVKLPHLVVIGMSWN